MTETTREILARIDERTKNTDDNVKKMAEQNGTQDRGIADNKTAIETQCIVYKADKKMARLVVYIILALLLGSGGLAVAAPKLQLILKAITGG